MDGDIYKTSDKKAKQLNKAITGHEQKIEDLKNNAIQQIIQLNLPEDTKPEKYLHTLIIKMDDLQNEEFNEIIEVAYSINAVDNSHKYILDIIDRLNYDNKSVGYTKIIDLVSTHTEWHKYISEVFNWLKARVSQVRELD